MGPPNKRHFGTSHFVHYREVVLRSKNVLLLWEMIILGHYELSFLERLSSSQRVLYRRFHRRIKYKPLPILITINVINYYTTLS